MKPMKKKIKIIVFWIGVNVIGLPDFHVNVVHNPNLTFVGSKYHK